MKTITLWLLLVFCTSSYSCELTTILPQDSSLPLPLVIDVQNLHNVQGQRFAQVEGSSNSSSMAKKGPNLENIVKSISLFKQPVAWNLFTSGVANKVVLITDATGNRFVLKIYQDRTLEDVTNRYELLKKVENNGIKTPPTIIPPHVVEGYVVWITDFIEGSHITDVNLPATASLMAQLHTIPMNASSLAPEKDVPLLLQQCSEWSNSGYLRSLWNSLDPNYLTSLPRGLIHGDFSYANVLVDDKQQLTVLDFDHLRYDYLLTDIVHSLIFYGFDKNGNFKKDTFSSILDTYQQFRPLTQQEKANIHTHLMRYLIKIVLVMYYHLYVSIDEDFAGRVLNNPENYYLNPEHMIKEIRSLDLFMQNLVHNN